MRTNQVLLIVLLATGIALGADTTPAPTAPLHIKNAAQLTKLLKKKQPQYLYGGISGPQKTGPTTTNVAAPTPTVGTAPAGGTGDVPFSTTNVQVHGVDEADIVKNDDSYIYKISGNRVLVINAFPDSGLALKSALSFDSDFYPLELYLNGNNLIVIGTSYRAFPVTSEHISLPSNTVKAFVFDTSNKDDIKQIRDVEMDGSYVSSRRIGDNVYLIGRKYPDFYMFGAGGVGTGTPGTTTPGVATGKAVTARKAKQPTSGRRGASALTPAIRDTAVSTKYSRMSVRNVFCFPIFDEPDYIVIASFNIGKPKVAAEINAYLGAGNEVYASSRSLYVAASVYPIQILAPTPAAGKPVSAIVPMPPVPAPGNDVTSTIYKFNLDNGHVSFKQRGSVPGTILNQYSMDESGDFFRVATTSNGFQADSSSALYVLDGDMQIAGKIENIAPGERIYSARFIGNRCYLVTFHQIDPFFVIDLSTPSAPVILGQLKAAGFSNYLQAYDDKHIMGFGKDTLNGMTQGLKISLYDVSDVNNPVENFTVVVGDRGSDSPVLYDPKALLFDASRNLLVLPVRVAKITQPDPARPWQYGDIVFDGAYVYDLSLNKGFMLRGSITHVSAADFSDPLKQYYYSRGIERSLFIGPTLYTLSPLRVKANNLGSLGEEAVLDLPDPFGFAVPVGGVGGAPAPAK